MFLASFSALAVPYTYMTAVQLGFNRSVSYLVGLMALLGTHSLYLKRRCWIYWDWKDYLVGFHVVILHHRHHVLLYTV